MNKKTGLVMMAFLVVAGWSFAADIREADLAEFGEDYGRVLGTIGAPTPGMSAYSALVQLEPGQTELLLQATEGYAVVELVTLDLDTHQSKRHMVQVTEDEAFSLAMDSTRDSEELILYSHQPFSALMVSNRVDAMEDIEITRTRVGMRSMEKGSGVCSWRRTEVYTGYWAVRSTTCNGNCAYGTVNRVRDTDCSFEMELTWNNNQPAGIAAGPNIAYTVSPAFPGCTGKWWLDSYGRPYQALTTCPSFTCNYTVETLPSCN